MTTYRSPVNDRSWPLARLSSRLRAVRAFYTRELRAAERIAHAQSYPPGGERRGGRIRAWLDAAAVCEARALGADLEGRV